jgi:hypothetical protein
MQSARMRMTMRMNGAKADKNVRAPVIRAGHGDLAALIETPL